MAGGGTVARAAILRANKVTASTVAADLSGVPMRTSVLLLFVLLGSLTGCGSTDPFIENCDDGLDNDQDDLVDCIDPDCLGDCPELCGDSLDNDGDAFIDCADNDCDGLCGEQCADGRDNDNDGLTDCADPDCNQPFCAEKCEDGIDNDADGDVDCDDIDCVTPLCPEDCFDLFDNDGDGLADCADDGCDGSCPEVCDDGRDNDGDGLIDCDDDDCDGLTCPEVCTDSRDNDNDGLTDCVDPDCERFCDTDEDGFLDSAAGGDDCDDADPDTYPGAPEVCDFGADNDCNGLADDDDPGVDPSTAVFIFVDRDGDGAGDPASGRLRCPGDGLVRNDDDCDDTNADRFPANPEVCDDGVDNDCDGLADNADPSLDLSTQSEWWRDSDGDGFGDASDSVRRCSQPDGFADNPDDCDDSNPGVGGPPC
ncbi:MAG: hypothetical protein ACI8PZ_004449 [Myxococcota bacterium]|jgi:hypothetical protein